jgi:uncharacterized protein
MTGIPAGPVFDFHVRLGPGPSARAELLAAMDASGIRRAAVSAGGVVDLDRLSQQLVEGGQVETDADNERVRAACADSGGRLVPVYFANPHSTVDSYARQAAGFRALELSPAVHGVGFDDPRTAELVRVAAGVGHCVYTVPVGRPGSRTGDLVSLARAFPDMTFVLGHCGFTGIDTHALNQIAGQPNIVAETSGCFTVVAGLALRRLGPERVLFGTEHPLQSPAVELAKFAALAPDQDTWHKVAWHNAHRLLREVAP